VPGPGDSADLTIDQALSFEVADRLGEHLVADPGRQSLQLVEAPRLLREGIEHDQLPLTADDLQRGR
jgi:hypothetical protein